MIDAGLLVYEGYHESKRCSMDTSPESHITTYTSARRLFGIEVPNAMLKSCDGHIFRRNDGRLIADGRAEEKESLAAPGAFAGTVAVCFDVPSLGQSS